MLNKRLIAVSILFLIILSIMQFTVLNIIGFDGYYHIKTADIIKKQGFIEEFPWAAHTIFTDNYADIQILFRILLIPFTFFGLNLGAKLASILFSTIAFVVFYWFLTQNKIKYAFFWSLLYLFTAESLMYRFMLPRQMPLVISLLILTIYFLQRKKYLFLGITSLIFVLLHSSFVFQLILILLYFVLERLSFHHSLNGGETNLEKKRGDRASVSERASHQSLTGCVSSLFNKIFSKKFDYKIIIYSLSGIILGLLINPYFPNNISMLYTQIFKVNLVANLFNVEWKPWPFFEFIKNNILVLFYLLVSIFILIRNKKITKTQTFYFSLTIFFFFYTILSRRMQEYLVPFSILALAFLLNSHLEKLNKNFLNYIKISAILILITIGTVNFILLRQNIINNDFLYNYDNCADWMKNNIPKNSLIFTNAYAFPYLFFKNSDLIYTHGIDLTYSYLYDAEEFERYMEILQGTIKDDKDCIAQDYSPDYVFSGKVKQDVQLFNYIVKHKENYHAVYEDKWCVVLEVR